MISFDEAANIVGNLARPMGRERLALSEAHGRFLAEAVVALVASPPQAVSAMDGYAVRDVDLASLPMALPIQQEIFAGLADPEPLAPGNCSRIFTGAPVPSGADRVVIQEVVEREANRALFAHPPSASSYIRARGSDFDLDSLLVPAGHKLGARQLVAIAAGDHASVMCWRRPRIAIFATGDELTSPGSARDRPGSIPESISVGVAALVREWGGEVVATDRLPDATDALKASTASVVEEVDLVIVTGGASVGERDYARRMFDPFGLELHFSKVAMKPGKPVWLGQCGSTLVMGLPGNPTSAMTTARLLLAPLIVGLAGGSPAQAWAWDSRQLAAPLDGCGDRETFARGAIDGDHVRPLGNQESGAQATLAAADVLIRTRVNDSPREAGEAVETLRF